MSDYNFKLKVFYSRYWNMYSTCIDAFTVDWHGVNGLFVPLYFEYHVYWNIWDSVEQLELWLFHVGRRPIIGQCYVRVVAEFIDQVIGYIDVPVAKMFYIPGKSQRYIFGITDLTFRILDFRQ